MFAKAKADSSRLKASPPRHSPLPNHQLGGEHAPGPEQESGLGGPEPSSGQARDFSKVPPFPTDRPHASSPFTAFPLAGIIQPKLVVGDVNDPLEVEAERAAQHVMRMPESTAIIPAPGERAPQRKCEACEQEEKEEPLKLARAQSHDAPAFGGTPAPAIVHRVLSSPGRPLEPSTRAFFEPRFGYDFSRVRVHTDSLAAQSAKSVGALAYTVGSNIVFGEDQYHRDPTHSGRLLAHELAHTIQQEGIHANVVSHAGVIPAGQPGMILQRTPQVPAPAPPDTADAALAALQTTEGPLELSLDLITGVPLTTEEMWELLLIRRAEPLSIPVTEVNQADARLADLDQRIAQVDTEINNLGPLLAEARKQRKSAKGSGKAVAALQVKKLEAQNDGWISQRKQLLSEKVKFTRGQKLGTMGQGAEAGTGQLTYAAIQVIDAQGRRIAIELSETSSEQHAEERIVARLRATFNTEELKARLKGAHLVVVTDQKVCKERCQPALIAFAEEFEVDVIESRYRVRPRKSGKGDATPRTTLRSATKPSSAGLPLKEGGEEIYRRPRSPAKPAKLEPSPHFPDPTTASLKSGTSKGGASDQPATVKKTKPTGEPDVEPSRLPGRSPAKTAIMEAGGNLIVDLILDLLTSKYQKWRNDRALREGLQALQPSIVIEKNKALHALLSDPWAGGTGGYYYNIYLQITSTTTTAIARNRAYVFPGSPHPEIIRVSTSQVNMNKVLPPEDTTWVPGLSEGATGGVVQVYGKQVVVYSEPVQ